jgi:hypothetical protein
MIPAKNKLLLLLSLVLLALVLASLLSPFFVARGVALWLRYQARRSGLTITTGEVRAPFLRPVEIHNLHLARAGVGRAHLELTAPRVEAAFRLAGLLDHSEPARLLRWLRVEHARLAVRGRALENTGNMDWATLERIVPEQFDISADQILFEQPLARVEMHDAHITGAVHRRGALAIASVELRGPSLQKTFADVHGVTRWQDSRLTIGSLHLLEGLEVDSLALDLIRLRATRIAAELAITVFNGNMRANFATERTGNTRVWEAAGSASGVSLSQLAQGLGLADPVSGSLRASKFSFRGDPRDLLHATGSIWTELTGFSWRERNADIIMVGANFYERTIQLQELYIKQRANELTLSGESSLSADWLNPDFRGDVAGSINDLGQFAELFGAAADSFAGTVAVRGRVHAHERKVDGELALTGDALTIFRNPVDSLTARLTLDSPRLQLSQVEIRRGEDFLRGSGQIDFAHGRSFTVSGETWLHDLAEYRARLPLLGSLGGNLFAQLDASGDETRATLSLAAQTADARISAKGTLRGDSVAMDSVALMMNDASVSFTGAINFADRKNASITLVPATDLRLAQNMAAAVCVRGFELHQGYAGTLLKQISLTSGQLALTDSATTTQTLILCHDDETAAQPLQLSVAAPTQAPTPLPTP